MAVFPIRLVIWSTSLVLWFPQSGRWMINRNANMSSGEKKRLRRMAFGNVKIKIFLQEIPGALFQQ